jgi:hypothetical protein
MVETLVLKPGLGFQVSRVHTGFRFACVMGINRHVAIDDMEHGPMSTF